MSEVLKLVLSLSLSGTILMAILFALKPLYKNRMSKAWQYYIWLVIITRMLVPFTMKTTLIGSVFYHLEYGIINAINPSPNDNHLQSDSITGEASTILENEKLPRNHKTATQALYPEIFDLLLKNLWIIWVIIVFALLMRKITMYQSFVRYVKAGCIEISNIDILNLLAENSEQLGIKKPIELYQNSLISSPMLIGFFRPFIVLPNTEMSQIEMYHIMKHELTHLKRMDMQYKWLVQITLCLHWFNPFMYLIAKEINNCCELSCDEAIVRSLGINEKKLYGDTLLASFACAGKYKNTLSSVALTESAEQIKERLDAIMTSKRNTKIVTAVTVVFTLFFIGSATGVGAYASVKVSSPSMPKTPWKVTDSNLKHTKKSTANTKAYRKEYAKWKIIINKNGYYYKDSLVRIFMDVREDGSFENFFVNNNGTVDIKLLRNSAGSIVSVKQIAKQEANEILDDYDIVPDTTSIQRLTKQDLPNNILLELNKCKDKNWYVLEDSKTQYIYYAALPHDYSFQIDDNRINIFNIGKKTGYYVLLAVPITSDLKVYYNTKTVKYIHITL